MKMRLATMAAAAALFVSFPALAAVNHNDTFATPVSRSVIDAGPQNIDPDGDAMGWAQGEISYLQQVCPTVLHSPGQYNANLVKFCQEPHG